MILRDKNLLHRGGSPLRQVMVRSGVSDAVGVPFNTQLPRWMIFHGLGDVRQHGCRLRENLVAGKVEIDAIYLSAAVLFRCGGRYACGELKELG